MQKGRFSDNWNKVNNKEELIELLKRYKGILNSSMIEYLNSLIELEFSVIRENITNEERISLSELEIYKRIAIYNIYNRALNLLKENNLNFTISENEDGLERLNISVPLPENQMTTVFDFRYKEFRSSGLHAIQIPEGYKTMEIGTISLYQTLESKEQREAELVRVMQALEKLYDTHNPWTSLIKGARWNFSHAQIIENYENLFTKLDSKNGLSEMEKRKIAITNQIRTWFLEDYGLTESSFEEIKSPYKRGESALQKTLVKKQPNLTIVNDITYV